MDKIDILVIIMLTSCLVMVGLGIVNYKTADTKIEIVTKNLSYLSDETVLELYDNFLSGTSGGHNLILVCGILTSDGIQIHRERLTDNKVFIREENTTNPRIEIHMKYKIGKIYPSKDCSNYITSERIKTIYIVPYGTVKNNFEIDYK